MSGFRISGGSTTSTSDLSEGITANIVRILQQGAIDNEGKKVQGLGTVGPAGPTGPQGIQGSIGQIPASGTFNTLIVDENFAAARAIIPQLQSDLLNVTQILSVPQVTLSGLQLTTENTDETGTVMFCINNQAGNKQIVLGDTDNFNSTSTGTILRWVSKPELMAIDAVSPDGEEGRNLTLGYPGFAGSTIELANTAVRGNMAIGSTYSSKIISNEVASNSLVIEGSVGVKTTTPSTDLDVNGSIKANELILNKPVSQKITGSTLDVAGRIDCQTLFLNNVDMAAKIQELESRLSALEAS